MGLAGEGNKQKRENLKSRDRGRYVWSQTRSRGRRETQAKDQRTKNCGLKCLNTYRERGGCGSGLKEGIETEGWEICSGDK